MTRTLITVPHSNPFPMFRIDGNGKRVYTVFDDKRDAVSGRGFVQKWHPDDMLSFQFSWENARNGMAVTVRMEDEDGTAYLTASMNMAAEGYSGTPYKNYTYIKKNGLYYNGVYVLSVRISDYMSAGDCFRVSFSTNGNNPVAYESDWMEVSEDVAGTKKIHYNQTGTAYERQYGTYFGLMVYGYDLRIPAVFTETNPSGESSVMMTSDGGAEIVSALPRLSTELRIGADGIGLPAHYVKLLNIIACCDIKNITGFGDFEITGGGFSKQSFPDYDNDFYTATIGSKQGWTADSAEAAQAVMPPVIVTTVEDRRTDIVRVSVNVRLQGVWAIGDDAVAKSRYVSRIWGIGDGDAEIILPKSDNGQTVSLDVVAGGSVYHAQDVTLPEIEDKGLGYMSIGDTFIIN